MDRQLFARRLRTARQFCGYSLEELARHARLPISRQSLYRYEHGDMLPRAEVRTSLASVFGVSEDYLTGQSLAIDMPMLRSSAELKLSAEEEQHLEDILSFWAERYLRLINNNIGQKPFINPLTNGPIQTFSDAIDAATRLRMAWAQGDGPIASVLRLMERKGIMILDHALPDGIYGLSTWADGRYPLVVVDMRTSKTTVERLRFTTAHELGHLLLPFEGMDERQQEKCCHKFASFFLFSPTAFVEEMGAQHRDTITLAELIDLKQVYGISVAAQIHEAYDLGIITRQHYDWWYDEQIQHNLREEEWGTYAYPETLGREGRLAAIAEKK